MSDPTKRSASVVNVIVMVLLLGLGTLAAGLGVSDVRFLGIGGAILFLGVLGFLVHPREAKPAHSTASRSLGSLKAIPPATLHLQPSVHKRAARPSLGANRLSALAPNLQRETPARRVKSRRGGISIEEQRAAVIAELAQHQRTLLLLRQEKAVFAAGLVPPHLNTQIRMEEAEINRITEEIEQLDRL